MGPGMAVPLVERVRARSVRMDWRCMVVEFMESGVCEKLEGGGEWSGTD